MSSAHRTVQNYREYLRAESKLLLTRTLLLSLNQESSSVLFLKRIRALLFRVNTRTIDFFSSQGCTLYSYFRTIESTLEVTLSQFFLTYAIPNVA